ncbi:MAG TPA: hypothetical protein VN256_08245 [Pyrinomonadaceae bacterium]|nr:hypothetical protein [Pyrinomonadaceae bacterium]
MIFVVKKVGKQWLVKNRLTKHTKGVRPTNSEAQRLAAQLEREQRRFGFEHVVAREDRAR